MYIYEAEAGCSGMTKLVRPGDELIFSSSNAEICHKVELSQEEGHLNSMCLPVIGRSFTEPLPSGTLMVLSQKNFPPETQKKVCWMLKIVTG